jgi:WD40 repeat protein
VGHEQTVYRAIFSSDGGQLATVSSDATVRLWDLDTGAQLFALRLPADRSPPNPLWDFDFRCTATGCWIAVPLTRGKLALYDLGPYAK